MTRPDSAVAKGPTIGVYLYLAWILALLAALAGGITLILRHGRRGVARAVALVVGVMLTWGLVAAGIGLQEGYGPLSTETLVLTFIGGVGLMCAGWACWRRPR